jgi:hypothetical protein
MNLDISYGELNKLSVNELKQLRNELAQYINTDDERKARTLYRLINDILTIKLDYGF